MTRSLWYLRREALLSALGASGELAQLGYEAKECSEGVIVHRRGHALCIIRQESVSYSVVRSGYLYASLNSIDPHEVLAEVERLALECNPYPKAIESNS